MGELEKLMTAHPFFKSHDPAESAALLGAFLPQRFDAGTEIAAPTKFDVPEDEISFWLLTSGTVSVRRPRGSNGADGVHEELRRAGEGFGETDIMFRYPREYTAVATSDVTGWGIDRATYQRIKTGSSIARRKAYEQLLLKVEFLTALSPAELSRLAEALQPCMFEAGDTMIQYGEEGFWMYFIIEGVVRVVGRSKDGQEVEVCTFTSGDPIGELEFIHHHNTVADCVAQTSVRAARISRPHFEAFMGPLVEFLKRRGAEDSKYEYYNTTANEHKK